VWGADHHGYVKRVEAALQALGLPAERFKVVLVQIVNLTRDGEPVRMGKRTGEFIALVDVVEEVGPDLARFFFLMRKSDAQLEFDLELARRQSAENPVFYVQYAHTRIAGIFRQAAERGVTRGPAGPDAVGPLGNDDELGLIRMLDEFPSIVEGAAAALEPHRVVFYVQKLAGEFHRFYTRNKCVSDDAALTAARLLLVGAVQQVIGRALRLVGVSAPERM
jgi:arginyl-tRNA synthetase